MTFVDLKIIFQFKKVTVWRKEVVCLAASHQHQQHHYAENVIKKMKI